MLEPFVRSINYSIYSHCGYIGFLDVYIDSARTQSESCLWPVAGKTQALRQLSSSFTCMLIRVRGVHRPTEP